jgi:hypothetical protein
LVIVITALVNGVITYYFSKKANFSQIYAEKKVDRIVEFYGDIADLYSLTHSLLGKLLDEKWVNLTVSTKNEVNYDYEYFEKLQPTTYYIDKARAEFFFWDKNLTDKLQCFEKNVSDCAKKIEEAYQNKENCDCIINGTAKQDYEMENYPLVKEIHKCLTDICKP